MKLEEAIQTAITFETRVRDTYAEAAQSARDAVGRRVFEVLGDEEQKHIDYLNARLSHWKNTGRVDAAELDTVVPTPEVIDAGVKKLESTMERADHGVEVAMLGKALQLEGETYAFYKKMVDNLPEGGELFERFLEIEKGHQAIVQAELDCVNQNGFFFDFQEFKMEH
jgi:rubrerythrin